MEKLFFDKSHWYQLLSTKNYWSISLSLILFLLHLSQPFDYVCCRWRKKRTETIYGLRWTLYYPSPSYLTRENFVSPSAFCLFFTFFLFSVLAYWDHYCKLAGFDSLRPIKKYWQVTLSNEYMNHLFWAYVNLAHYCMNP